ncbi:MAG: hypothetical protein HQ583_00695 [Candidatus Abyssubacteria bacterium]|nr:hypothetical protein [Candidatus Abyssubacteria bacterium]
MHTKHFRRFGIDVIDTIALASALTWLGAVVGLSAWHNERSILTSVTRGLGASIFVYMAIYIGLHLVVRAVVSSGASTVGKEAQDRLQPEAVKESTKGKAVEPMKQGG